MKKSILGLRLALLAGCATVALAPSVAAAQSSQAFVAFDIPAQDLDSALTRFGQQSEREIIISSALTRNRQAPAVQGSLTPEAALNVLLADSGLTYRVSSNGALVVEATDPQSGSAAGDGADGTVDTLVVTAQKREEDIQDVPIAISAFTQETLDTMKIEGGPDLLKAIPNVTFTKTNFSSYNIQIRGIGTQAISATTDPAVAVAFNATPFIRNHLFEQEFFDVERVEVLRGPQGTLYGRNATAGVVNIISAKPTDRFEAMLKAEIGNYDSRRLSGFLNIPIVDDKLDLRLAGAWTSRQGYAWNETRQQPIDGRDLYSTRFSLRFSPTDRLDANFIWEHFQEDDDRIRSAKQLCKKDPGPDSVDGLSVDDLPPWTGDEAGLAGHPGPKFFRAFLSQGCLPTSFYSDDAYQTPNGASLPFIFVSSYMLDAIGNSNENEGTLLKRADPYLSRTQPRDLRVIQSDINPTYHTRADVFELNIDFDLTENLTLTSLTGYNIDRLHSTQDFNRFNTAPGFFADLNQGEEIQFGDYYPNLAPGGIYCDPQLGCSDKFVAEDMSRARSKQFTQEFRIASSFDGPFNFSLGINGTRYKTLEDYYVAFNILTLLTQTFNHSPPGEFEYCYHLHPDAPNHTVRKIRPEPFFTWTGIPGNFFLTGYTANQGCQSRPGTYIDPNPLEDVNGLGHNYFRSKNPYLLRSAAAFGEVYYEVTPTLKVTAGLRWTDDRKRFQIIPSWTFLQGGGYPVVEEVNQEWKEWTGRLNADWSPDLSFTDETMIYASYAHGYKGGGANPPGPFVSIQGTASTADHPETFEPEFVDAFEIGTKNTLLGGGLILNGNVFYYDYKAYQISQIVDRTAINQNFDAEVWGAELESVFSPTRNLNFNLVFGYQDSSIGEGMRSIDLMDRTAGNPDWIVVKPFVADTSNCILPTSIVRKIMERAATGDILNWTTMHLCEDAYSPVSAAFGADPTLGVGYDGSIAPNLGAGFFKELAGNELPNTPHWTWSLGAQYTRELPGGWEGRLRADFYHQSQSFFRVYNYEPYDKLRGWSNVNLSFRAEQAEQGLVFEAYVKNLLDSDAITGAFLNSDDTALTTNVFTIDPRLIGLQITKRWNGDGLFGGLRMNASDGPSPIIVEVGGGLSRTSASNTIYEPEFADNFTPGTVILNAQEDDLDWGLTEEVKLTYAPRPGGWRLSGGFRYGKTAGRSDSNRREAHPDVCLMAGTGLESFCIAPGFHASPDNYGLASVRDREEFILADFMVGKDVGLGVLGSGGYSAISAGLRYARFNSSTQGTMNAELNWYVPAEAGFMYPSHYERSEATFSSERSFQGAGPAVTWDASKTILGDGDAGRVTVDWSVSAGALFGRQKADVLASESGEYFEGNYFFDFLQFGSTPEPIPSPEPIQSSRSTSTTVPLVGLSLGLSYEFKGVKVSGGYRAERYFNALDGGIAERETYDRTIDGPYFKIAVGFGR